MRLLRAVHVPEAVALSQIVEEELLQLEFSEAEADLIVADAVTSFLAVTSWREEGSYSMIRLTASMMPHLKGKLDEDIANNTMAQIRVRLAQAQIPPWIWIPVVIKAFWLGV